MKGRPSMRKLNATTSLYDIGTESGIEIFQHIIIGFENNNVNEQTQKATIFNVMDVTKCYCKIGNDIYPEENMKLNIGFNNYVEDYKEIIGFN